MTEQEIKCRVVTDHTFNQKMNGETHCIHCGFELPLDWLIAPGGKVVELPIEDIPPSEGGNVHVPMGVTAVVGHPHAPLKRSE